MKMKSLEKVRVMLTIMNRLKGPNTKFTVSGIMGCNSCTNVVLYGSVSQVFWHSVLGVLKS
jgi:hypothetical protein